MWSPAVLRWPSEAAHRARLRAAALPCLLLVEAGAPLPEDLDLEDEDWVRLPAADADIAVRSRQLGLRFAEAIRLDGTVLRTGHGAVALSPGEAAVLAVLLLDRNGVAPRTTLLAGLGLDEDGARPLYRMVHRLRRCLRPLGIDVFAVRERGYRLGIAIPDGADGPDNLDRGEPPKA